MKAKPPITPDLPESATRKIVEKWSPSTLLLFASIKALETLAKLGIVPKEDPWRKWTRAFQNREDGKIVLPVFRLKTCRDWHGVERRAGLLESPQFRQRLANRLACFLRTERDLLRRRLDCRRGVVRIVDSASVDIVLGRFDDEGRLAEITPNFEGPTPTPPDAGKLEHDFVRSYNETLDLDDKTRPLALTRMLRAAVGGGQRRRQQEMAYLERLLSSVFVHFEAAAAEDRFQVPDFSRRKHPGQGVFNILCRPCSAEKEMDLWVQANHILVDGNPVLQLIDKLRAAWGTAGPVTVPAPSETVWRTIPTSSAGCSRAAAGVCQFLCFDGLLAAREKLNQNYARLVGDITLASLIVWGLAHHPAFQDVKVATVVELLPGNRPNEERTVSFVNSRPARFLGERDRERSFLRFQADFNRQIEAARRRESAIFRAMQAQSLLPVPLYTWTNALIPRAVNDIAGKVCLTVMKDADLCVAPIDDRMEATIAVGNALMPAHGGGTAGVVSVTAVKGKEQLYREAVCNAICHWRL